MAAINGMSGQKPYPKLLSIFKPISITISHSRASALGKPKGEVMWYTAEARLTLCRTTLDHASYQALVCGKPTCFEQRISPLGHLADQLHLPIVDAPSIIRCDDTRWLVSLADPPTVAV